jgi:dolichol kinase
MVGNKIMDNSFEFRRKLFHISLGIIIVILLYYGILKFWICLVLLITGLLISFIAKNHYIPVIKEFLEYFDRPKHKNFPGRGVIAIFFSSTLLILLRDSGLLSQNIVLASIMIWTFGDSLSAMVGINYGKVKHPFNDSRFIEGTASGIVGGALAAFIFVPILPAIITSFIAITIESLELSILKHPIDDNLLVPLISALILVMIL